ncbi:MAG: hypothetical protein ACRDJS_03435 [Actinomycetota bacterium]
MTDWLGLNTIQNREFIVGLQAGLLALGFGAVAGVAWLLVRHRHFPGAGLLLVAGTAWGLREAVTLPSGLAQGLAALAGAGLIAGFVPMPRIAGSVLAIPGAWLVASQGDLVETEWIRILVMAATVVGGTLVADFDRRWGHAGFPPVLLAVSVVGVYFTLPDTEQASVLLGATLPLMLLGWPRALAGLGSAGAYAATGLLAWTSAAGGFGRPSSIVGGIACLGLMVVEPLARAGWPAVSSVLHAAARRWWGAVPVGVSHLLLVYVASRWAGLQPTVDGAALIVSIELCLAVTATVALGALSGRAALAGQG